MKKMRIGIMMVLFCVLCMWQAKAVQADVTNGKCGKDVSYSYDSDTKTLTLSGSGATYKYEYDEETERSKAPFNEFNVKKVIIEEGITSINESLFLGSTVEELKLPNSLTTIGPWGFYGCKSLKSVVIPDGVNSIKEAAFEACKSLKSVKLPKGLKSIGRCAFMFCTSLKSIVIPKGVKTLEYETFCQCNSLTSVTIPNTVTKIKGEVFACCYSLKNVTIPSSVTNMGNSVFSECYRLEKVTIKNKKTYLSQYCFSYDNFANKGLTNPKVVLYGYKNSTTQKFANKYKIGFQTIGEKMAGKTSITKITSSKSGPQVQMKWKKVSKAYQYEVTFYTKAGENGYRNHVRVFTKSTSLKFKKYKDLKKGKTYYVRVRAYAKRNGKQIISPWSAVKKLKMKK